MNDKQTSHGSGPPNTNPSREERVYAAAYRRYLERGHLNGNAMTDWIDAEAEVDAEDRAVEQNRPAP